MYVFMIINQILIAIGIAPSGFHLNHIPKDGAFLTSFLISTFIFNLIPMYAIASKGDLIQNGMSKKIANGLIWFFSIAFFLGVLSTFLVLNIWGNLIYAPTSLISGILCLRIAREKWE